MNRLGVILCGGSGARLSDMGGIILKPMITFDSRPFVEYLFWKIFVSTNAVMFVQPENNNTIKNYFKNLALYTEGKKTISKSIYSVKENKTFDDIDQLLICYGDTIADVDLKKLYTFHKEHEADVTITSYRLNSNFGIIESVGDGILIKKFEEKPMLPQRINIGYMVVNWDALKYFNTNSIADAFNNIIKKGRLCSYKHEGKHWTYNSIYDVRLLKNNEEFRRYLKGITPIPV